MRDRQVLTDSEKILYREKSNNKHNQTYLTADRRTKHGQAHASSGLGTSVGH